MQSFPADWKTVLFSASYLQLPYSRWKFDCGKWSHEHTHRPSVVSGEVKHKHAPPSSLRVQRPPIGMMESLIFHTCNLGRLLKAKKNVLFYGHSRFFIGKKSDPSCSDSRTLFSFLYGRISSPFSWVCLQGGRWIVSLESAKRIQLFPTWVSHRGEGERAHQGEQTHEGKLMAPYTLEYKL